MADLADQLTEALLQETVSTAMSNGAFGDHFDEAHDLSSEDENDTSLSNDRGVATGGSAVNISAADTTQDGGESSSDESDDDDSDEGTTRPSQARVYDPAEYKHLVVSSDIQGLFHHIGSHTAQEVELETKFRPFIPDYIPAVGDIDAFLKVPRPDGKEDRLGLKVLDEPAATLTDPTVLEIMLKQTSKTTSLINVPVAVRSIEHADKNPQKITTWVKKIDEVHVGRGQPTVNYAWPVDIEKLMQAWPREFEELLKTTELPRADIEMSVKEYSQTVCALLDIPVGGDKITHSLHVLFTLFSDFKNNAHFQA